MDPSNGKRRNPRVAYLNKNTSVWGTDPISKSRDS
jgi:hypothetical protein